MPLQDGPADLQFLRYDPEFRIAAGEPLTILGPAGDVVTAVVPGILMERGQYSCAEGVREFRAQVSTAFRAAGGSGGPVLKTSTGTVVGVLLTADDPTAARVVGFETLCLGRAVK